jgi:hypothetical protein
MEKGSTKKQVLYLRKQGLTIPEISKTLGIGIGTIGYHLKNQNLKSKKLKTQKDLTFNEIELIVKTYIKLKGNLKKTNLEIDFASKWTIKNILIKENIYNKFKPTEKEIRRKKSLNVINWKKQKKLLLIQHKGGKCERCGYNKCEEALEFHHLDPTKKDFTISSNSYSFQKMKTEADKCILVCSNCHREIHWELKQITKVETVRGD